MRKLQLARGIIINRKIAKGYENLVFAQAEKSMTGGAAIAAWAAGHSLASGAAHTPSVVGKERKSSDMPCFKWINTILGNLNTATGGTYHAFDFEKYGFLYLAEAQYRFNRRFEMSTILTRLIHASAATGSRTEAWTIAYV